MRKLQRRALVLAFFLVSPGSAFQKTRKVASELAEEASAEAEPFVSQVLQNWTKQLTDLGEDPDEATVHVTIDITELPEPDNETIVDVNSTATQSVETSFDGAFAEASHILDAKLFAVQGHAKNATDGVLDGLVELLVLRNCSATGLLINYSLATGLNLSPAISEATSFESGSCVLVVDSSTANAMIQDMVDEHEKRLVAEAKAEFKGKALQLRQSAIATVKYTLENASATLGAGAANSSPDKEVQAILSEMNLSLTNDLHEAWANASQAMDKFVDATLTLSLSLQTSNASLGPLPDLKRELASAQEMLNEAESLAAQLEATSSQVGEAAIEAVSARTKREAAGEEMAHFVNVSIQRNREAQEALTAMLDGNFQAELANLTAKAQEAAAEASKSSAQQAEQDKIFKAAEQKHSALANQEYRLIAALKDEMEGVMNHTAQALEDSTDQEQDVKSLSQELNLTVTEENSTAEASTASGWWKTMSDTWANATQTVANATDAWKNVTESVASQAGSSSSHWWDKFSNASQAADAVTSAANTTSGWLNSISDMVNSTNAAVSAAKNAVSPAGNNSASVTNLTTAVAGVFGSGSGLLEMSSADRLMGAESNPGNVTIKISVENGNESLLDDITKSTEANLKALSNTSAQVSSSEESGQITVRATIPEVNSESVQDVVESTAAAIQDVLGDDLQTSGEVSALGNSSYAAQANTSEEIIEEAAKAAEIFEAPEEDKAEAGAEEAAKDAEVEEQAASSNFPAWLG
eukprot:CAMPEP_0197631692 /NCGR_PEP_ID=MMETSP1338-20131121/8775_1 /TAXON_ID=43686 ORGANISM="Pelagodinium beii, Strain RCC1491" /NCGR_SAMPLE_ID=MMETSP1338 /ASSEMBLY_ACC=CAM_ASM_000754 /LENGTH=755 /DNA_ID=CAMNT_0043203213 /DNA_START=1833 /DNA_END=4097 /DNA_ORIENTATION=+